MIKKCIQLVCIYMQFVLSLVKIFRICFISLVRDFYTFMHVCIEVVDGKKKLIKFKTRMKYETNLTAVRCLFIYL